jgi:Leucine-rich repeat (LRR) protein
MYLAADSCPQPCTCTVLFRDALKIDCSQRQLKTPPQILPVSTTELILSQNSISVILNDTFHDCRQLRMIDLSRNQIEQLATSSFSSLMALEELYLNDNNLHYTHLSTGVLSQLVKLRVCHLHNNIWTSLTNYPKKLFQELTNVEFLTLDGFPNASFGNEFSRMTKLRLLHVYGGLQIVRNDTFSGFRNVAITELSLKTSQWLHQLEPESFSHFPMLKTLDLSYNQNIGFKNVSNAWWGLQFTNITKLALTRIVPAGEQTARLTEKFYQFLSLTRIDTLLINKNNIVDMASGLSTTFPFLQYLDVSYNRVSNIVSLVKDIIRLKHLEYFDCSHQVKRFDGITSAASSSINSYRLKASQNAAKKADIRAAKSITKGSWFLHCRTLPMKPCEPSFSVADNVIMKTRNRRNVNGQPLPDHGTWCLPAPPRLKILNITASLSLDLDTMPAMVVFTTGSFSVIEYSSNGINRIVMPIIFSSPTNLTIDWSDNGLSCFAPDVFRESSLTGSNVLKFQLSGNRLSTQLEQDVDGQTFIHYGNMTDLNLARNGIKSLPVNVFRYLSQLQRLNLSQNSLRLFDFEIRHMTDLVLLDLSHNLIATFDCNGTLKLDEMFRSGKTFTNLSVDLTGNPLQCSCDTLIFLKWISSNQRHMINFPQYACWFNGSYVMFSELDKRILVELSFQCSRRLAVIVSASLCALGLVLVAISVCTYRYRWEVRYWCLWLTQRSRLYRELVDDIIYQFDAFVVYAKEDAEWVRNELVPRLENDAELNEENSSTDVSEREPSTQSNRDRQLALCYHERDFVPGNLILSNMWEMMENSRKVLLVISRSFVKSDYCDYEMNLARVQSVQKGCNLFVPVILEPVDLESMSAGLRWIVQKLTYIEWPTEDGRIAERDVFWRKLRNTLNDSGHSANYQQSQRA